MQNLIDSEEYYRSLFENKNICMLLINPGSGSIIDANPKACKYYGYERSTLVSMNIADINILPPEKIKREMDIATKGGEVHFMFSHKLSNGTLRDVDVSCGTIRINGVMLLYSIVVDITERILVEKKIRDTQILLHSSIESPKDMVILSIDKNYRYLYFNTIHIAEMMKAYGTAIKIGMDILDCITMEMDRSESKVNFDRALAGESHVVIQGFGDGVKNFYETRYNPIFNDEKEIIGATLFAFNITERIQVENALKDSEERYKRITAGLTDYVYTVKIKDGKVYETVHSEACLMVTGYSAKEFAEDPFLWIKMVVPEDKDLVAESFLKIMEREYFSSIEHRIICKDGSICWISDTLIPKFDMLGDFISYDGIIKNITERKEAEILLKEKGLEIAAQNVEYLQLNEELLQMNEELHLAKKLAEESEEKFRQLFENMEQAFAFHEMIYDANNKPVDYSFVNANIAFKKLMNITATDFIGNTVRNLLPELDQDWIENCSIVAKTGIPYHIDSFTYNNESYYDIVAFSPKLNFFALVFNDITKTKNYEKELIAAKEHAEESDRLKTAFLQNMSHEIRTPMNAIMGFSQLLVRNYNNKPKLEKFADIINQRCSDLLDIINDILDISKIESGQLPVNMEKCNLVILFDELLVFFKEQQKKLDKQHIILNFQFLCNASDVLIITDQGKLKQIFINLIGNAFKFTETGTIEGGCKLGTDNNLIFYVSDTGIGISRDKQKFVFDRFTQVDQRPNRLYGGTGLGLSIVKGLVRLLGGEIWVESEPGKGSTFSFALPYQTAQLIQNEFVEIEKVKEFIFCNKTILVVEDDIYNAEYLKEVLSDIGLNIIHTAFGNEAIEIVRREVIDLILMDIRLPDMNGYEASLRIRQLKSHIKIIVQTAYASNDERQIALDAGCNDYISKPLSPNALLSMLRKHLA